MQETPDEPATPAVAVLLSIQEITGKRKTAVINDLADRGVLSARQLFNIWGGDTYHESTLDALRVERDRIRHEYESDELSDEDWKTIANAAIIRLRGSDLRRAAELLHRLAERTRPIPIHQRRRPITQPSSEKSQLSAAAQATAQRGKSPRRAPGKVG